MKKYVQDRKCACIHTVILELHKHEHHKIINVFVNMCNRPPPAVQCTVGIPAEQYASQLYRRYLSCTVGTQLYVSTPTCTEGTPPVE
jgi:hypothetical protein